MKNFVANWLVGIYVTVAFLVALPCIIVFSPYWLGKWARKMAAKDKAAALKVSTVTEATSLKIKLS